MVGSAPINNQKPSSGVETTDSNSHQAGGALKKLGRKKKECSATLTTQSSVTNSNSMNVVVKNRFKHTKPNQHSFVDQHKTKNALQTLATSYGEPPAKQARTDNSPLNLLANVTCQQQHQQKQEQQQQHTAHVVSQSKMPIPSSNMCPKCQIPQGLKLEENVYKCMNCNQKFLPVSSNTAILPHNFYAPQNANVKTKVTKKKAETIDLVSSDENEDDENEEDMSKQTSGLSTTSRFIDRMKLRGGETGSNKKSSSPVHSPALQENNKYVFECNKAMFGQLHGHAVQQTRVEENRMYLSLECAIARDGAQTTEKYTLSVGSNDVIQFLVYFGRVPSFVAIETSTKFASVACKRIGKDVLFPGSSQPQKRFIILALKFAFKHDNEAIMERDILNAALSPWSKVVVLSHQEAVQLISQAKLNVEQNEVSYGRVTKPLGPIKTMVVYPPSLKSGGIPITNLDLACLDEGTYLNDIIIDFYLKFICETVMTKEQKEKTYIFNSYFYKRLTQKASNKTDPAQIHAQVKKWTRNVDIFDKDYVIIPINEHSHWYLAIVCFHGQQLIKENGTEKEEEEEEEDEDETNDNFVMQKTSSESSDEETPFIANSPPTQQQQQQQQPSCEKTSSEETNDEISNMTSQETTSNETPQAETISTETTSTETTSTETTETPQAETPSGPPPEQTQPTPKVIPKQAFDQEQFKRPCILIFDSLVGSGHSRVFTNLRKYLSQEWISRKPNEEVKIFDKNTMKGCYPKVPRQNNDCDCGVFLLQYAEFFFSKPIQSFRIPVHLETWFTIQSVTEKREDIKSLITKLAEEYSLHQNKNNAVTTKKI